MLIDIFLPTVSWALTSGPSQPEVQSFEPASTTQMVDLFTGDFTYNIPLFELPGPNGGYPFNLAYHAGIGMDQEASWVGLGWSLNPGAINRQMRGLPDEFKGDKVVTKKSIETNYSVGVGAGIGAEIFGADVSVGQSIFYNSYKGVGMDVDIGLTFSTVVSSDQVGGLSLDLNANSQEGVGLNASLSLSKEVKAKEDKTYGLKSFIGAGYNSRQGLTGMSFGFSGANKKVANKKVEESNNGKGVGSYSSSLSLANPGYVPAVGMPMLNSSINLTMNAGGAWWGIEPNISFKGFYNEQRLLHNGKNVHVPSYGYLNYQHATEDDAILDFNREKDGLVRDESPNLGIPSTMYDIYSASGQGYSAMYRPMRGDVGILHDPTVESSAAGLSLGADLAPLLAHFGVNGSVNLAESKSGKWENNNEVLDIYSFTDSQLNDDRESVYFKAHGESTVLPVSKIDDIGGEDAVMLELGGNRTSPKATRKLIKGKHKNWSKNAVSNSEYNNERLPRNSVITEITNGDLKKSNGNEVIDLLKIQYYKGNQSFLTKYNRNYPDHHLAGFIALTPEGNRYVYGIPAYNTKQETYGFSTAKDAHATQATVSPNNSNNDPNFKVKGTNNYFSKESLPPYAHSYLLTAIVGQDYVDVTGDGVSEDDLGYWVKFSYRKTHDKNNPYKWRTPYYKANYFQGFKSTGTDDQASFLYGEKEIWYLDQVETKSHIAKFWTNQRQDGRGAAFKLQNEPNSMGAYLSQLDSVHLYTRYSNGNRILKKVKFQYDNSLCKNIENGPDGTGKLTLKKLWFEYGRNKRGKLNPYIFDYHEDVPEENPDYGINDYDRWGNYKPNSPDDPLHNQEYPYVEQDDEKAKHDIRAGAWSLKEITLPSGGQMIIDYESDDYAYVQNRRAMHMLELVDPITKSQGKIMLDDHSTLMCVKLARPIPVQEGIDPQEAARPLTERDRDMLLFKVNINLRSSSENQFDFVDSYVSLDKSNPPYLAVGSDPAFYEYLYFTLSKEKGYHPISLRSWQHLKVNQPDLASAVGNVNITDDEHGLVATLKSLVGILPMVRQMLEGFNHYAKSKDWGREINGEKSWVRFCVPDGIKYGGGHRVRQITLKDSWKGDDEGIYGTVYKYDIYDGEFDQEISSGVAANEPNIGAEENPIRYAKKFTQNIPMMSNNTLFFEYPVNEGYYPSAQVGYRKVTVMSLASAAASGEEVFHADRSGNKPLFPSGEEGSYGTTGKTVNEFYTAKDFPVIADETMKEDIPDKLWLPIWPLGTISAKRLASSQGYSVITNDMHGKQRKVSNFAQTDEGEFEPDAFSWIKYNYFESEAGIRGKKKMKGLDNLFADNGDGTLRKASAEDVGGSDPLFFVAQQVEFFGDMRQSSDKSYYAGGNYNTDVVIIPLLFVTVPVPIPSFWPNAGSSTKILKTAVLNKVIFKAGIMESVEAFNQGSYITTRHVKWDKLTGRPVLSIVNNNFDKPIYNQEIPAHMVYAGVGPAYENTGFKFDVSSINPIEGRDHYYTVGLTYKARQVLYEGDEWIVFGEDGVPVGKAVYLGKEGSVYYLYSKDNLTEDTYSGLVYRSGKRNLLSANAGNITALKDPTQSSGTKTYSVEILSEE